MKLDRESFEAPNEFADFGAELLSPAAPAPEAGSDGSAEAQSTEGSEAEGQASEHAPEAETPATESAEQSTDAEGGKSEAKPESPKAPAIEKLAVKSGDKTVEFNLAKDDKQLQETLALGLGARKWQAERDEAIKARKAAEEGAVESTKTAKVWKNLEQLVEQKHDDLAAMAVLGEQGMERLRAAIIHEYQVEQSGDDVAKARLAQDKQGRLSAAKEYFRNQELQAREESLTAEEDRVEQSRLKGVGMVEMRRLDFGKLIDDKDVAQSYNEDLWTLAWSDLQRLAETKEEISAEDIKDAFANRAKRLGAAIKRQVATVVKTSESKAQEQARKTAAVQATARYPGAAKSKDKLTDTVDKWDGKSMGDLVRALRA